MTAPMDADMRALLEHCRNTFAPVKPLISRHGRPRIYRRLKKALHDGLLIKGETGLYKITERGTNLLDAPTNAASVQDDDPLVKAIPHLAIIGRVSPVHQAVAGLLLAAAVARTSALRDSHHANFIILGGRLLFKTWVARACCAMLGVDDRLCVLHSVAETKGAMFKRRGGKGQIVSERGVLTTSPICAVDEFQRASHGVREVMSLVMHGQLTVPFENETATIRAVPVLILNPLKESANLTERTGFDEALLRRSIVVDLAEVRIPEDVLPHGDAMLDELRRLPSVNLIVPADTSDAPMEKLHTVISRSILTPELLADIDLSLVGLLGIGMRSFLPDKDAALRRVVQDYLLLLSTSGRTRDDWRENMHLLDAVKAGVISAMEKPRAANPFSWHAHLDDLGRCLDEEAVGPQEFAALMQNLVRLREDADGADLPGIVATMLRWQTERLRAEEQTKALQGQIEVLQRHAEELEVYEDMALCLAERGLMPGILDALADIAVALARRTGRPTAEAGQFFLAYVRRALQIYRPQPLVVGWRGKR